MRQHIQVCRIDCQVDLYPFSTFGIKGGNLVSRLTARTYQVALAVVHVVSADQRQVVGQGGSKTGTDLYGCRAAQ